jgi:hypothetical protein
MTLHVGCSLINRTFCFLFYVAIFFPIRIAAPSRKQQSLSERQAHNGETVGLPGKLSYHIILCHFRNYTFVYEDMTLAELSERALELTIWDHDRLASNEFLGGVRFSLGTGKWNAHECLMVTSSYFIFPSFRIR